MLIGWLLRLLMNGLLALAEKALEVPEDRPVLRVVARGFAWLIFGVVAMVVGAISIAAVIGFFWLIVWRQILSRLL